MRYLNCGPATVAIWGELLRPRGPRLWLEPFVTSTPSREPSFWVSVGTAAAWTTHEGPSLRVDYTLENGRLMVPPVNTPTQLEAVLRLIWYLATARHHGLMLHASGVAVDGLCAVVTGPSGTGKTTLALHAESAGATLLSDEILQLLPDGVVYGTPFASDPRSHGTPGPAKVKGWLTVEKAKSEQMSRWPLAKALVETAHQVFTLPGAEAPVAKVSKCLGVVSPVSFACRDHPQAGQVLVEWLSHGA